LIVIKWAQRGLPDRQCELRSPGGEAFNGQKTAEQSGSRRPD
jgi:hypothetical protein